MARREFPSAVRAAAFLRADGICEGTRDGERCGLRLQTGKFAYDHDLPDYLGGEPTLSNCRVLCAACHGEKTAGHDVPRIAKTKRQARAHIGAKRTKGRPMAGSRASGIRKRMSGEVTRW